MTDLKQETEAVLNGPTRYAQRDPMALDEDGGHYIKHVNAMTAEGLHSKADIAEQLAHRDWLIAALQAENDRLTAENITLIEDRARFPNKPDVVGQMIAAHYGNLKAKADQYEKAWRSECIRSGALQAECGALRADAERLDLLDRNLARNMGWHVGQAPAGNYGVTSVIFAGSKPVSIRDAIDDAMREERGG